MNHTGLLKMPPLWPTHRKAASLKRAEALIFTMMVIIAGTICIRLAVVLTRDDFMPD
jgi:hypothetical protein